MYQSTGIHMDQSDKTSLLPKRDFPFYFTSLGLTFITKFLVDRISEYRNILEKNGPEKTTLNTLLIFFLVYLFLLKYSWLLISFFIILLHWKCNAFNSCFFFKFVYQGLELFSTLTFSAIMYQIIQKSQITFWSN